ncbi:MAG: EamA family transporter [Ignavibacteriaceae bacterium]|jgi:drug/metabolite transporter (DMT)-like permease
MNAFSTHQKGLFAAFLAGILWSTGGLFIKLISLNPFQLSFFRSLFSAATFLILFKSEAVKRNKATFINALFYAAILILFVIATKMTTAANAIFLQYTAPIYVLILEPILLKTKFEKINIVTIILAFTGMVLFFLGELSPGYFAGNIVALISGMCFAGFLLGMRKNDHSYQFATIFWGNIIIAAVSVFSVFSIQVITFSDLTMVAYLGIVQIGLAYAVFTYSLKRVHAIEASLISMIEPVLNPVWVFIWYGEKPSTLALIGGAIILLGLTIKSVIYENFIKGKAG